MKKIALTALSATIIFTGISSLYAESTYYEPTKEMIAQKQQASSTMRMQYYEKYLAKGYDVSSLKPYLDGSTTTESEFWEALKKVQNNHEVAGRKAHVEKLKSKGYDVSGFTEEIIWDSGKFWEMVKMVESSSQPKKEMKSEEYKKIDPAKENYNKEVAKAIEYKKEEMMKKVEEQKAEAMKKLEEKKAEMTKKVEENKVQIVAKVSSSQAQKLQSMMKDRIAKLPTDTREATLVKLETALTKSIETARAKNAKLLVARYEILLAVVQEEINGVDDETLIDSLFQ